MNALYILRWESFDMLLLLLNYWSCFKSRPLIMRCYVLPISIWSSSNNSIIRANLGNSASTAQTQKYSAYNLYSKPLDEVWTHKSLSQPLILCLEKFKYIYTHTNKTYVYRKFFVERIRVNALVSAYRFNGDNFTLLRGSKTTQLKFS